MLRNDNGSETEGTASLPKVLILVLGVVMEVEVVVVVIAVPLDFLSAAESMVRSTLTVETGKEETGSFAASGGLFRFKVEPGSAADASRGGISGRLTEPGRLKGASDRFDPGNDGIPDKEGAF